MARGVVEMRVEYPCALVQRERVGVAAEGQVAVNLLAGVGGHMAERAVEDGMAFANRQKKRVPRQKKETRELEAAEGEIARHVVRRERF